MRTLSAAIAINEKTFEPVLKLLLDDEETGTTLQIEALTDLPALHGPEIEEAMIDMVLEELHTSHNLTADELTFYKTNFRSLLTHDKGIT